MSSIDPAKPRFRWLPALGSWKYHLLLGAIAIFILGPLGGVTATYMNFSIGFFVGGQVLAGILGSAVTFGYGAEGKHGANYMQTLAASVASMAAMAVLIQAMVWLGFDMPPAWKLILYYLCIGMFGVGVGMLYTPLLVDKMRLTYPSGLAVANILRALTDKLLLRVSIVKLGIGTLIGGIGGIVMTYVTPLQFLDFSGSTFGAGMIVGARITIPGLIVGLVGDALVPFFQGAGWIGDNEDQFRKIGFVIGLGTILGAAIIDIALVLRDFARKLGAKAADGSAAATAPDEEWKRVKPRRLYAWVLFWGATVFFVGTEVFEQQPEHVLIAIALVFVFMMVNGISLGISDSNPISAAFVMTVFLLSAIGLGAATGGLVCASILLIAVSIGGDMQQDRSTGWRLGTSRVNQFRYQVIGVSMGAVLTVAFASLFMTANPVLYLDQSDPQNKVAYAERAAVDAVLVARKGDIKDEAQRAGVMEAFRAETLSEADKKTFLEAKERAKTEVRRWPSSMTYKFVGALSIFMDRPQTGAAGAALTSLETQLFARAFTRHKPWYPAIPPALAQSPEVKGYRAALAAAAAREEPQPVAIPEKLGTLEERKAYGVALNSADREQKKDVQTTALLIGIAIGVVIESIRKALRKSKRYQTWKTSSRKAKVAEFALDTTILASPYASSFGGFVPIATTIWFGLGGIFASVWEVVGKRRAAGSADTVPEDMSTNSLIGGGMIAGESLFFLVFGIVSLLSSI